MNENRNNENKSFLERLKEHKTPVAIVVAIIVFLSLGVVLWNANSDVSTGNDNVITTTEDLLSTEVVIASSETEEDTEVDYLGNVTTAPENTESTETVENTEDIIEFPSDESTEVNSEVDNTEDSSESNNSESTSTVPNTSESTTPNTSESEVIVDNNNSESTNTPSSGEHVNWVGSTGLPNLGISIPTLGSFNSSGLNSDSWTGEYSSTAKMSIGSLTITS